ncbi:MAG: hypothetical protein R3258_04775 [Acidimicrobiia bacterium]|nr:hypothetical protein [Acidimicrobiia bacterium]
MRAIRGLSAVIAPVVARPSLIWEALRAALSVRRHSGLGMAPDYLGWRMITAYGAKDHPVEPGDLTAFLRWRRSMRALARWAGSS